MIGMSPNIICDNGSRGIICSFLAYNSTQGKIAESALISLCVKCAWLGRLGHGYTQCNSWVKVIT